MKTTKIIADTIREYFNEQITHKLVDRAGGGDYIYYYLNNEKIGYVEYYYDGGYFSDHLPGYIHHKEFYLAMIEVFEDFRGNDYSTQILNHVKKFAKQKGATILTLRVDNGMGFSRRVSDKGLEKLYLRNGFVYTHTEDESKLDDTKNLGAMHFML